MPQANAFFPGAHAHNPVPIHLPSITSLHPHARTSGSPTKRKSNKSFDKYILISFNSPTNSILLICKCVVYTRMHTKCYLNKENSSSFSPSAAGTNNSSRMQSSTKRGNAADSTSIGSENISWQRSTVDRGVRLSG